MTAMNYHHRDYQLALEKVMTAPLTLRDKDFDVLREFGGPQEERRGRDAVRKAQLAILTSAEVPLETKAADRPRSTPPALDPRLARVIGTAIGQAVVVPLGERMAALTHRIDELEALTKQQAATLVELRSENKALGQFIADTQRRPPSSDRTSSTKH